MAKAEEKVRRLEAKIKQRPSLSKPLTQHELTDADARWIAKWEGFSPTVYADVANHATIGFGSLLHYGPPTQKDKQLRVTKAEAIKMLKAEAQDAADVVNGAVQIPLTHEQWRSLVDFTYNLGAAAFLGSTMLKRIRAGEPKHKVMPEELRRWVYAGGEVWPGLVRRRKAEARPFLKS